MKADAVARKARLVGDLLFGAEEIVGPWVHRRAGGEWLAHMPALGVMRGGRIVAGCTYEVANARHCFAHIAGEGAWATRAVLHGIFYYPFITLGCFRVTAPVARSNEHGARFCLKSGFTPEATLCGAAGDGGDLILFRMFRHECRWIGSNTYGQGQHEHADAS